MKPTLSPYLMFSGNAKEAMEFYKSVLGGELVMKTYGESGQAKSDNEKDLIMHAELKNDSLTLMASDGNADHPVKNVGDNIHLSISGTDENEELLTKFFNGLSEGGQVQFPLSKQFWGDTFGMFTDKFGFHWMVNIASSVQKKKS
ncbi:MAG TPA: VOC family protein [Methylomirabilota bacterium]|nr:VOC family protein [Methylomirabilota bacterium]